MPALRRRLKPLVLITLAFIVAILYLNNRGSKSRDFYATTLAAINAKERSDQATQQKLVDAQRAAQTPFKSESPLPVAKPPEPEPPSQKSIAGRKIVNSGEKWDKGTEKESGKVGDRAAGAKDAKTAVVETKEEHEVEVELNSILKKGPIIIFSKTYCPHSKKAKSILLSKYTIKPPPYVVELDEHPLGSRLQDELGKSTGRRTVPNVLINGKSIGGGDDVQALDESGDLIAKVRSMGGKRIMEAKLTH